jgi:hypothetical protein
MTRDERTTRHGHAAPIHPSGDPITPHAAATSPGADKSRRRPAPSATRARPYPRPPTDTPATALAPADTESVDSEPVGAAFVPVALAAPEPDGAAPVTPPAASAALAAVDEPRREVPERTSVQEALAGLPADGAAVGDVASDDVVAGVAGVSTVTEIVADTEV